MGIDERIRHRANFDGNCGEKLTVILIRPRGADIITQGISGGRINARGIGADLGPFRRAIHARWLARFRRLGAWRYCLVRRGVRLCLYGGGQRNRSQRAMGLFQCLRQVIPRFIGNLMVLRPLGMERLPNCRRRVASASRSAAPQRHHRCCRDFQQLDTV
jgi:hypothetical protein